MNIGSVATGPKWSMEPLDPQPVPTGVPWPTALTRRLRFKFFLTGFLFPLICLVLISLSASNNYAVNEPWQSGDIYDYVTVLTRPPAIFWFYPILTFSLVSLALWCWQPYQFSRLFFIRFGLYTGILLSLTFMILLCLTTSFLGPIMALLVMATLAVGVWAINKFARKLIRFSILNLMVFTTIVAVVLAFLGSGSSIDRNVGPSFSESLFLGLIIICGGSPTTGFITFIRTSVAATYLTRNKSSNPLTFLGSWGVWLSGFAMSWKFAIDTMLDEYAKLPTTDPNCYISSAAATGHRWLVRSQSVNGKGALNLQMKRCKFLEFALTACCPSAAGFTRRLYNRLGPVLARFCQTNAWFADLTYLLLKPLEWFAVLLHRVLKIDNLKIKQLYERRKSCQGCGDQCMLATSSNISLRDR